MKGHYRDADVEQLIAAATAAKRLLDQVLPHFNWGASALSADDIHQLNTVPRRLTTALNDL
jgi:hypothetical protein